ncbi:MAG: DinB family protein [Thermoanaerobaculia bacterium]
MTATTRKRHTRILEQLDRMIELVSDPAKLGHQDSEISAWSVGQQVEHLACVHRSVGDAFDKLVRDQGDGPGHATLIGRLVLFLGWIPRGRGKVPERSRPKGISAGELAADLARQRQRFTELDLEALEAASGTLPHPAFGPLTALLWLRMLEVHNHHHWKIVGDILQSSR